MLCDCLKTKDIDVKVDFYIFIYNISAAFQMLQISRWDMQDQNTDLLFNFVLAINSLKLCIENIFGY